MLSQFQIRHGFTMLATGIAMTFTASSVAQTTAPDPQADANIIIKAPMPSPSQSVPSTADSIDQEVQETEPDIRGLLVSRNEGVMNSLMTARVKKLHVRIGERVAAGAPLVTFECDDLQARLRSAQARLKQHKLILEANRELELEQAVTRLDLMMAGAKVEEGTADLQSAWAQLERCEIKAPYAAVITDVEVSESESVQIGDALVELMDDRSLDMVVHVPSEWIKQQLVGKHFDVSIDETGKTYPAVIKRLTPKIDATSGTVEVTATVIGRHPELLPGMSGAANFDNP